MKNTWALRSATQTFNYWRRDRDNHLEKGAEAAQPIDLCRVDPDAGSELAVVRVELAPR